MNIHRKRHVVLLAAVFNMRAPSHKNTKSGNTWKNKGTIMPTWDTHGDIYGSHIGLVRRAGVFLVTVKFTFQQNFI